MHEGGCPQPIGFVSGGAPGAARPCAADRVGIGFAFVPGQGTLGS